MSEFRKVEGLAGVAALALGALLVFCVVGSAFFGAAIAHLHSIAGCP